MKLTTGFLKQLKTFLLTLAPLILLWIILFIPGIEFLIRWYFRLFNDSILSLLIFVVFFSVLFAFIEFLVNKKKEPPYINESSFSYYYIFITLLIFIRFFYMTFSTLFLTYNYQLTDFLHLLIAYVVGLIIIYIPLQFIVFLEDSNILSTLFSLFIRLFVQFLFIYILYVLIYTS